MQPTSTRILTNNLGDGSRLERLEIDEEDLIKGTVGLMGRN